MRKLIVPLIAGLVITVLFVSIEFLSGFLGFPFYIACLVYSIIHQESIIINLVITYVYITAFVFAGYYVRKTRCRYIYWILTIILFFVLDIVGGKLSGIEDIIRLWVR